MGDNVEMLAGLNTCLQDNARRQGKMRSFPFFLEYLFSKQVGTQQDRGRAHAQWFPPNAHSGWDWAGEEAKNSIHPGLPTT